LDRTSTGSGQESFSIYKVVRRIYFKKYSVKLVISEYNIIRKILEARAFFCWSYNRCSLKVYQIYAVLLWMDSDFNKLCKLAGYKV